ncbi:MAG: SusC/RagA family TonB-linked outer membrane protein [Cyclonatronaceae bacterium]
MTKKILFVSLLFIFLGFSDVLAQTGGITGVVTDSRTGETMPGTTVFIPSLQRGTTTGIEGRYTISGIPAGTYNVRVSFVGYSTINRSVDIEANQITEINFVMEPTQVGLDEVVVIGFGTSIRRDLTGSIASVSASDIENLPVNSVETAIQGRVPGVYVSSLSGKLGQGITMRIRGSSSLTASNQPLYVIDGIPATMADLSGNAAPTNPLADFNFNDVESIEILKDASAAAIYGSQASNGVVLITTKRGRTGRTNINYSFQGGFSEPAGKREWLNSEEYIELFREAGANLDRIENDDFWVGFVEGRLNRYSAGRFDGTSWQDGVEINTDWQDLAFQDAAYFQHELSFSGGNESTRFFTSGSYSDQEGILIGNKFERISGRLNLDHRVSERLSLGLNMNLARSENHRLSTDNAFATPVQLVAQPPITPPYDPRTCDSNAGTSFLNSSTNNCQLSGDYTLYYNGLIHRDHADFVTTIYRNFGNAFANFSITPGVTARTEFGVDILNQNEDEYYGSQTQRGVGGNNGQGLGISRYVQVVNYTWNSFLTYSGTYRDRHVYDATGGITLQNSSTNTTSVTGRDFPSDSFKKLASAAEITSGSSTGTEFSFLSYFARANYKYNERYLLSLSGRVDGSSRFGDNNRYGFFPAASVGWVMTEEEFLRDNRIFSFLKLRASYGLTGNAAISNFGSRGLFGGTSYNQVPGIAPSQAPNEDLKWEQTAQLDVGIDYGFLNNRITGEIDYYVKNTKDLLLGVNVPGTSGYTTILRNVGKLENRGFEFNITSYNFVGEFNWSTTFNWSTNVNKLTDLDGQIIEGSWINRAQEGYAIGVFFEREYAGVNPDNGDAIYYLNREATSDELNSGVVFDKNGRLVTADYGAAERVVIGDPNPDWIGGFGNNFSWKGFDLNVFFQFVYGNDIYMSSGRFTTANGDWFDNQTKDQMKRWRQPGDITDVPEARFLLGNGAANSSRYISDGSYLRLKSLTFGYNLPGDVVSRVNMRSARVFVQGTNLLTFTKYDGYDPEVNADFTASNINQGIEFYSAPQPRTITFGFTLGF